jgi:hypothetical protein
MVVGAAALGLMALVGCGGKGETVNVLIQPIPGKLMSAPARPTTILVNGFVDAREKKERLGARTHLWGGETYFNVPGGKPGDVVAEGIAGFLKEKGAETWLATPGHPAPKGTPDVTLSGQVQELNVNAKSGFMHTEVFVSMKVSLLANNHDGSSTRMSLQGSSTETVFMFDPEDVQTLINQTLADSLEKLYGDVRIEKGIWKTKS